MLINERAAMACSALVHKLEKPIRLEPLSRFPVIRDLAVDHSVLFENFKPVQAWVPLDGTYDLGPGTEDLPWHARKDVSGAEPCDSMKIATMAVLADVRDLLQNPAPYASRRHQVPLRRTNYRRHLW